jgi:hypothetical protein
MFKNIANRRHLRMVRLADLDRPDQSYSDLLGFQRDGYEQAVFVKNPTADEQCAPLNGKIYEISELLKLDNPLFRISHPNCLCKFSPYGESTKPANVLEPEITETAEEPATLIQRPEVPPMTMIPAPPQTKTV